MANPSGKSYAPDPTRGYQTFNLEYGEQCVIPKAFPLAKDQTPSKKQIELCGKSFYTGMTAPKANSTNPAVLIQKPKDDGTKGTDAKFKQTITCSDTSSIMVYGYMADFLGVDLEVPDSVLRTMSVNEHKKVQASGMKTPIKQFWALFPAYYAGTTNKTSNVISDDGQFLYGALSDSPHGDKYKSFNGPLVPYEQRMQGSLMKSQAFAVVTAEGDLSKQFKDKQLTTVAQKTQWARDEADMIVLDTLFGQQDRPFNIDRVQKMVVIRDGKSKLIDPKKAKEGESGPLIDVLMMSDNDCGVSKGNRFRQASVIEKVRHMSPKTYERVMLMAEKMRTDEAPLKEWFKKEMLYSESDFVAFKSNLARVETVLKTNKEKGILKLDADIDLQLQ